MKKLPFVLWPCSFLKKLYNNSVPREIDLKTNLFTHLINLPSECNQKPADGQNWVFLSSHIGLSILYVYTLYVTIITFFSCVYKKYNFLRTLCSMASLRIIFLYYFREVNWWGMTGECIGKLRFKIKVIWLLSCNRNNQNESIALIWSCINSK